MTLLGYLDYKAVLIVCLIVGLLGIIAGFLYALRAWAIKQQTTPAETAEAKWQALQETTGDPLLDAIRERIQHRTQLTRQWGKPEAQQAALTRLTLLEMQSLTAEQRVWVMDHFCRGCGSTNTACTCQNDE